MNQALDITGSLTTDADNIGATVSNSNDLTLTGGTLNQKVAGSGTTTVTGDVTNNETISQDVTITSSGNLTNNNEIGNVRNSGILTSSAENLTGTIENNQSLNLSGTLAKTVSGNGTTYVANMLTFDDGANINSTLNLASDAVLNTTGSADSTFSAGSITGGGNVFITNGALTVKNNAQLNSLKNTASVSILGDLNAAGNITSSGLLGVTGSVSAGTFSNTGVTTISGNLETQNNLENTSEMTVEGKVLSGNFTNSGTAIIKGGAETKDFINDGTTYITGDLSAKDITNNKNQLLGITGTTTASNVTNHGDLDVGGNLIVQQIVTNTGFLDVTGYMTAEQVNNTGEINIGDEANVSITGDLTATEDITTSGTLNVIGAINAQNLENQGSLTAGKNAELTSLTNSADGIVQITGNITAAQEISNLGSLKASSAFANNIANSGTMTLNNDLSASGEITNTGSLTVLGHASGNKVSNTGTLSVKNGADFGDVLNESLAVLCGVITSANLENSGEMDITGSLDASGNVTNTSKLTVSQDLTTQGDLLNSQILDVTGSISGKNITNDGTAQIEGNVTTSGKFSNTNTFTAAGFLSTSELTNTGTLTVKNGAIAQSIINDGAASISGNVQTSTLQNNLKMEISGSLEAQSNITNTSDLTVTQDVTALGEISNTKTMQVTGSTTANNLTNEGTFSSGGNLKTSSTLTNKDQMTVSGTLTAAEATNTGSLTVQSGAIFGNFTNETLAQLYGGVNADSITNSGSLNIQGGSSNIQNIQNSSVINITDAAFAFSQEISGNGELNIQNSTFSANGIIDNQVLNSQDSTLNLAAVSDILKTSTLNTSGGTINTADGQYVDYKIKELNSTDTKYNIDIVINKDEQKADTFTLENGGSGKIFISSINVGTNILNNCDDHERYIIQIIKSASPDAPQLDYDGSKVLNQASANMSSDEILAKEFGLRTTTTTNDSLEIRGLQDTFCEWADFATAEDKSFTFVENSGYILSRDIEKITGDKISIYGNNSTFNANSNAFLSEITENQDITISDLTINNSPESARNNGTLSLNNVKTNKDFTNNKNLNISGTTTVGNLVNNAQTTFTGDLLTTANIENNANISAEGNISAKEVVNNSEIQITGSFLAENISNSADSTISTTKDLLSNNLTNDGTIFSEADITVAETLTNNAGAQLTSAQNTSAKNIQNHGTIQTNGSLYVSETLSNADTLTITGPTYAKNFTNTGSASIQGTLEADEISNSNTLETNSNIIVSSTLTNTGSLTTSGSLRAKELTNEESISVSQNLIAQNLTNNKNINVNENLAISQKLTNNSTLNVQGSASVDEIINAGEITLGNETKKNTLTANKITNTNTININNSTITLNTITAETRGTLNISNSTLNPAEKIENQDISASNTTINAPNPYSLVNNSLNLSSSTLNLGALSLSPLHFTNLELNNNSTINIPSSNVDFSCATMGRITTDNFAQSGENSIINLNAIRPLNLPDRHSQVIKIPFADTSFSNNVKYNGQSTVYGQIFQYGVTYDYKSGNMYFVRGGQYNPDTGNIDASTNPSDIFDPSILTAPVTAQAGATATINQNLNYAFQHSDNFMLMPAHVRLSEINKNKYAIIGDQYLRPRQEASMWYKPYASFESTALTNGPKVHSTLYGSIIGVDSAVKQLKYGWAYALTGYLSYNGANLKYKGINANQNGAILGSTLTLYRGNFFNATTVNTGTIITENSTMYGHETPVMLLAGIANKTGYNIEAKNGRIILQPNLLISYSYINTFTYRNAAGITINADPLNNIQIAPGIKLIANTKTGWQPYFTVSMVWNTLNKQKVTVENIQLPQMSIEPYVQYGLGVQKTYKENFIAFGQALVNQGGRNGVSLNVGLRWNIGKDDKKTIEKVEKTEENVIKTVDRTFTPGAKASDERTIPAAHKEIEPQKQMQQSKENISPKTTTIPAPDILRQLYGE